MDRKIKSTLALLFLATFGVHGAGLATHATIAGSSQATNIHTAIQCPGLHGTVVYSNYLFGSTRQGVAPVQIFRFNLPDINNSTNITVPAVIAIEQLVVISNQIYFAGVSNDLALTGPMVIGKVDPATMALTLLSTNDSLLPGGTVLNGNVYTFNTDTTNLFVSSGFAGFPRIYKIGVDGGLIQILTNGTAGIGTNGNYCHAMAWDGTNLYAAGPQINSVPPWIQRINHDTMGYTNFVTTEGLNHRVTDDMTELGEWLYLGMEQFPTGDDLIPDDTNNVPTCILRVKKDFSSQDFLNVGITNSTCLGTFQNGGLIWIAFGGYAGYLVRMDPTTLQCVVYDQNDLRGLRDINEVCFWGSKIIITQWGIVGPNNFESGPAIGVFDLPLRGGRTFQGAVYP